ncbi:MAG: hypothetical protein Q9219_003898 [cf. Caloplaca sp. 3 TL-2023]
MDDSITILAESQEIHSIQTTGVSPIKSSILHRSLNADPLHVESARGSYIYLDNGMAILDASGGAAVTCIGHGDERVRKATYDQMGKVSYALPQIYTSSPAEDLAEWLIDSTEGKMSHCLFMCSGSEATETALKLARQYFLELSPPQPERCVFISRRQSYHGATLGALAVSGHRARRANYEPLMLSQMRQVSPCNEYRYKAAGESSEAYVARLAQELEDEIIAAGADKVCAFIAETIVGATTACMPPAPGYFQAMHNICDKYGVLLILDEIMCGNGRCGTMHAWQAEGITPDIQTMGKGLGGGYQPIAAVLLNKKVHGALEAGTGSFAHGQTYQSHILACAAALEVQRVIRADDLLAHCARSGAYLASLLRERLAPHPNVGDVRGRGLFWGIEFVRDRVTKEAFDVARGIANAVHGLALERGVAVYPGVGTADGVHGDHVLVAPALNVGRGEIERLVRVLREVVGEVFEKVGGEI